MYMIKLYNYIQSIIRWWKSVVEICFHLLIAAMNVLYVSNVMSGRGSRRKYSFRVPVTVLISLYVDRFMEFQSENRQ